MCDLLRNETEKIGYKLMYAWLRGDGCQRRVLPLDVGLVGKRTRQLVEQLLRFLGENMLHKRLDVDVVKPIRCGKMGIRVGSFG